LAHPPAHDAGPDPADPRLARLCLGHGHRASPCSEAPGGGIMQQPTPPTGRSRRMEAPPRAPIVLVHGLLGFDRVKVGPLTLLRYFPGIEDALQVAGHRVGVPSLSKTRGVARRA